MRPSATALQAGTALLLVLWAGCGGGEPQVSPTGNATPVGLPTVPPDSRGFQAFVEDLSAAISNQDVAFLENNTALADVVCETGLPAPPASCSGAAPGTLVRGILVGIWQSEGYYLDSAGYGQFVGDLLTAFEPKADDYGTGAPTVVGYGQFLADVEEQPPEVLERLHLVITWIPGEAGGSIPVQPGRRAAVLLACDYSHGSWKVTHLHLGTREFVDPVAPDAQTLGITDAFSSWTEVPDE